MSGKGGRTDAPARPDGPRPIELRVEQVAPRRADSAHNARLLEDRVARAEADGRALVVFPELALTGYDLGRRAAELAHDLSDGPPLSLPSEGPTAIFGLVERGRDHLIYNTGVVARGHRILHRHRKIHLPTYGPFDEGRIFAAGRGGVGIFAPVSGWAGALLVCEDLWHPALPYLAGLAGADVLFVLAAAVGRGAPPDGGEAFFTSTEAWELLARSTALIHGCWVVVANRAGTEGALAFAGGSIVVAPDGHVEARAPQLEPAVLDVTLDLERIRRARGRYSHLRDEEPSLVLEELERIRRERREHG